MLAGALSCVPECGSQATVSAVKATQVANSQKGQPSTPVWVLETSGTTASLRGIHALDGGVAWASGTDGTVLRTEDGGSRWQKCVVPKGAEKLDFRGVWGWDAHTAVVMSSGPGDASRIYKTTDGCQSWKLLVTNKAKDGFWDAIYFEDKQRGWLLGDPVDGRFQMSTVWLGFSDKEKPSIVPQLDSGLKADSKSAGAFAASNSSVAGCDKNVQHIIFGTGGTGGAFIYFMTSSSICVDECSEEDLGRVSKWKKISVPLAGGSAGAGVFSVAMQDTIAIAVGGDYEKPAESAGTAAYSLDNGKTWTAAAVPPHGYRSAVAWDQKNKVWIAAGTNGSDYSRDNGKTWVPLDDGSWNALSLPYVVGPKGRIAKLAEVAIPPSAGSGK
jgi:photosystem II stability/assembly factor-like uncharacterized protein